MITCAIEDVGPEEAEVLLAKNDKNRPPRPRNIDKFVRDMTSGRWVLNGETIAPASGLRWRSQGPAAEPFPEPI